MREILFRGKRIDNGEWVEGLPWKKKYNTNKLFISCFPDKDDNEEAFVVVHETVGQYTGLTDKNGTKIFEGDILEFSDRLVSVFWHTHLGCWDSNFIKFTDKNNGRDDMSPCRWGYRAEVVGNIHDNPELLEGGE